MIPLGTSTVCKSSEGSRIVNSAELMPEASIYVCFEAYGEQWKQEKEKQGHKLISSGTNTAHDRPVEN